MAGGRKLFVSCRMSANINLNLNSQIIGASNAALSALPLSAGAQLLCLNDPVVQACPIHI